VTPTTGEVLVEPSTAHRVANVADFGDSLIRVSNVTRPSCFVPPHTPKIESGVAAPLGASNSASPCPPWEPDEPDEPDGLVESEEPDGPEEPDVPSLTEAPSPEQARASAAVATATPRTVHETFVVIASTPSTAAHYRAARAAEARTMPAEKTHPNARQVSRAGARSAIVACGAPHPLTMALRRRSLARTP
jgi:hypothetical protein